MAWVESLPADRREKDSKLLRRQHNQNWVIIRCGDRRADESRVTRVALGQLDGSPFGGSFPLASSFIHSTNSSNHVEQARHDHAHILRDEEMET